MPQIYSKGPSAAKGDEGKQDARRCCAHAGFEDYDVLSEGKLVGRIYREKHSRSETWFWGLSFLYHRGRCPISGYEATREAVMSAFCKCWDRI
jgi:hypothetical protein